MLLIAHGFFVVLYIFAIIYSCFLFSNAIEHLGIKLKLGNNATGSILAVLGTCLPETVVPLVAILGSIFFKLDLAIGQNVAKGAIIGSPFILSTLALFLMGIMIIIKKRKNLELNVDYKNILRDYRYFLFAYSFAILAVFINLYAAKVAIVFLLLLLYCVFVYRTIIKSKQTFVEQDVEELVFAKMFCAKKCEKHGVSCCNKCDSIYITFLQIIVSLAALVIFSHFFVSELEINPIILSLVLAPVATELPEIVNSIIWLKQDKDDLAVANVIGAIVFQAMVPCSIGILLTPWKFEGLSLINMLSVLVCGAIFIILCAVNKKVKLFPLLFGGVFYFGFLLLLILRN